MKTETLITGLVALGILVLIPIAFGFLLSWLISVVGYETGWGILEWLIVGLTFLLLRRGIKVELKNADEDEKAFVTATIILLSVAVIPFIFGYGVWLILKAFGILMNWDWIMLYLVGLVLLILRMG